MKKNQFTIVLIFLISLISILPLITIAQNNDSIIIRKIFDEALSNGQCYQNLEYLTTKIGGRLSGSPQAAQAVEWAKNAMIRSGFDTVYLQECMVPHWVRGAK